MSSIQLPPLATRGAEGVFSPPISTAEDVVFRSPRPSKQSNIRVVTRIRPLLEEELKIGRKAAILPIQPVTGSQDFLDPASHDNGNVSLTSTSTPRINNSLQSIPHPSSNNRHNNLKPPTPSLLNKNDEPQLSFQNSNFDSPASSVPLKAPKQEQTPSSQPILTSLHAGFSPASKKQFDFDAVLGMDSNQQETYNAAVGDKILRHIIRGVNVTIMAYGQTGSGKTHTMQGLNDANDPSSHCLCPDGDSENQCPNKPSQSKISDSHGIIPRAIHDLFQGKMEYEASGKGLCRMELTYFEIYNDEIRDLLSEDDEFRTLKMIDQGEGGVIVEGLTNIPIVSASEVHELIKYAAQRRATSSTNKNTQSSRSHAVCTLTVRTGPDSSANKGMKESSETTQAKLTLVDLAGSERIKKTGVVGLQQQESITINKDLFVLGKVVSALADKNRSASKGKQAHIPFRDSKLTRLLRESLGGNCFTVLISCVSPADIDMEESINTLRYADRARSISNSIKRNVTQAPLSAEECAALQAEIKRLKTENSILKMRENTGSLLDQEEGARTPAATLSRKILHSSSNRSTQKMKPEAINKTPTPVWRHFQELAKYSGDVPETSIRQDCDQSMGIEFLGDRTGHSDRPKLPDDPDRCLAYEMSLLPASSADLTRDDKDFHCQQEVNQKQTLTKLQEEEEQLQCNVSRLKEQSIELESSLSQKQQELLSVTENVEKEKKEIGCLQSEIMRLKNESESIDLSLSKQELLEEEVAQLERFLKAVKDDGRSLTNASPQKSFYSIENDRIAARDAVIEIEDEASAGFASKDAMALQQQLETSFGAFHEKLKSMESKLQNPEASSSSSSEKDIPDTLLDSSNMIDLAAQVEEQQKTIVDLERRLSYEQRKKREFERNNSIQDSHVLELRERICELETELNALKSQKLRNTQDSFDEMSSLKEKIESLEMNLKDEKERCACFEARHNFICQDYDSMASALQEKISSLQDQARVEKQERKEEIDKFRATEGDLENQIDSLKDSAANIRTKLEDERSLKKNLQENVSELQIEAETLKENLQNQKDESASVQQSMRDSFNREIRDLEDQVAGLNEELKKAKEQLNVTKVDASTSTAKETQVTEMKVEDVQDALLKIIASASGDLASAGEERQSPENAGSERTSPNFIRMQAEKLLMRADAFIDSSSMAASSALSSAGTDFRPSKAIQEQTLCQPAQLTTSQEIEASSSPPLLSENNENEVHITNLDVMEKQKVCSCSSNTFAANAEYVEFYLPKISVDCTCGKMSPKTNDAEQEDPCALASILRPWQVDFLASVGITEPVSLVHANNQRGGLLAKDLRSWRKAKGLPSIKTRSCAVALHIWSRTCKSVVRNVRNQQAQGLVPKKPEFLELNISENNTAVSSLGGGPFHSSIQA